jgi:ribose transport system substrate-binding protein
MKKGLILLLAVLISCSFGWVEATASSTQQKTVGFASFQMGNDWNIQLWQGAESVFNKWGWKVIQTNADGDTQKELSALEGFLSAGVDAVIVGGGEGGALAPAITKLSKAGIPVVTVDIVNPDSYTNIVPNNYKSTLALSLFVVNKMQGKGKIVHLTIPGLGWYTVTIRDDIADKVFEIEKMNMIGILDSGLAEAVQQSMNAVRSTLLKHPDLGAVYCSWGMPAIGAAKAVRAARKQNQVIVVCTDADRAVLLDMMEDDSPIAAVAAQVPKKMGELAAEYTHKALIEKAKVPMVIYPPMYIVTKQPDLVMPGIEAISPDAAWDMIYPGVEKK